MLLSQLLASLNISQGFSDVSVSDIAYDSRQTKPGCLFVCIKGSASDGHRFAAQAAAKGAAAVLAQEPVEAPGAQVILVPDTKKALSLVSAAFFGHPAQHDLKVIGITGTKGKTTTAYMIRSILEAAGHKTGIIGTVGAAVGKEAIPLPNTTPISYEVQKHLRRMADMGCQYVVMEVSSVGLKDHRVHGLPFAAGVFTNFSEDHIGGVEHKDMEEYLACKAMLFSMCPIGVVNADDPSLEKLLENSACRVYRYGMENAGDLRGGN